LHLGAGENVLDGWLNTDIDPAAPEIAFLDTSRSFPLGDQTVDYVLSEHHLEHLSYRDAVHTLRECRRVLRPGGRIRIATPDLGVLLGLYGAPGGADQQRYIRFMTDRFMPHADRYSAVFVINNAFASWGHQFLYDRSTLRELLVGTGYVDVAFFEPGTSADPHLCGVERHGAYIGDDAINRFETMVAEARRP
jgi:predicted SAM-dependent methyltransferase